MTDWLNSAVCLGGVDNGSQINLQIAKQGYRLAAWLNVLIDGETNLP